MSFQVPMKMFSVNGGISQIN